MNDWYVLVLFRVGRESGPSVGRVGSCRVVSGRVGSNWFTKFSVFGWPGWVGSGVKNI